MNNSGKLTAIDGVPFVYPENGKTFDPYFFQTISREVSANTMTVEFDYGFGFVDTDTLVTNETYISPNVENIRVTSTGGDTQFRIVSSNDMDGV